MDSFLDISRALQVVFGIGLVIFVHELGHFIAARFFGVRVEVFSLGFGPRILGLRRGATMYQVSAVPIGGYVRMAGEERRGETPRPDDLSAKSVGHAPLDWFVNGETVSTYEDIVAAILAA